jgi:hypothetical protein
MDDDAAVDMVVAEHRRLETAAVEPGAHLVHALDELPGHKPGLGAVRVR